MSVEGFFGPNEDSLVDMVQMWGLAKTTGILTVKSGRDTGEIHFQEGRIVWAKAGPYLKDEDAVFHILAMEEGRFRFINTKDIRLNGRLNSSYQELIMEAMRRLDHLKTEKKGLQEKAGLIPYIPKGASLSGLTEEERVFLGLVDGKKNLQKVFSNCGLGVYKSFEVFNSLQSRGLLGLRKVRVLVVDDQQMWRDVISQMLSQETHFEVVGTAEDGVDALEKLSKLKPDVMTLDLQMPRLDGIKTLYWMMSGGYDILLKSRYNIEIEDTYRCPVVVISAVAKKMAPETLEALMGGATGYITKPSRLLPESLEQQREIIAKTVRMASQVDLIKTRRIRTYNIENKPTPTEGTRKLVCVGASLVGGLTSLMQLVPRLPADLDAAVFVMVDDLYSEDHTKSFAEFLDRHSKIKVECASKPMLLKRGCVYLVPADRAVRFGITKIDKKFHTAFKVFSKRKGGQIDKSFRPLDEMLFAALRCRGLDKRIGVVLAGDGTDGKLGFLEMVKQGEQVFVQDFYSSLNPIKPENVAITGVARVVPLSSMVKNIVLEMGRS